MTGPLPAGAVPGLAEKIAFLTRADAYPGLPAAVEVIHTHMACVFLVDHHAYKLKKPVRTDFLDFSTVEARRRDCEEEVRLNRRLAPDVYLGTVPLTTAAGGGLELGGSGPAVDWLVRMRRLPADAMLDRAIRAGTVTGQDVRRFASALSAFYRDCEPVEIGKARYRARFAREIAANRAALLDARYGLPAGEVKALFDAQTEFLSARGALLDARVQARRIVEGHGDLRPEHIALGEAPVFIDCLEFNRDWRLVDPVDELAYLAMECEVMGAAWVGDVALATWCELSGDRPPQALVAFYKGYRAGVRAKLAARHLDDHPDAAQRRRWTDRTCAYFGAARRHTAAAT